MLSAMRIWSFGKTNLARSCLIVTRKSGKGGKSRSQRETMQMWEGEIGGAERSVHTMYMAYTQSCAEHMRHRLRRTRHLEMGAGWDTEVRGEASTSTGDRGSTSFWRGGGRGSGVEVNGIRQHARANLKCNHHWKNMRVYTFQTNEKERGILGFLWKYLKCLQTGLPLRAFFFLLNIG